MTRQGIVWTYPDVKRLNGSAEAMLRLANMLWATNVFTLALLEYNALIFGVNVDPSLLNLLLMEPADHDLASRIAHLLAGH